MMKDLVLDESMSNLTSTSGEVSASTRIETAGTLYPLQQSFASADQAPAKKKRNLPGNPDPGAEVIALSPKTLLATNRFICEICNKGFQRDQNLQLHRRGHNLPWKLKQRTNKEVRKKVYVCPETTCVHHDPSRALGDLTGIKKHFCRKHGEKKWKCEKCSKPYAVQSDWKAHSKICGTREYRCDCGTLFSRRDSFITHRAFCDALAEESARAITAANPVLLFSQQPGSSISHMTNLQPQLHSHVLHGHALSVKREQDHLFNARVPADSIAPLLACPPGVGAGPGPTSINHSSSPLLLEHRLLEDENPSHNSTSSNTLPPFQTPTASPHMSATALLQKAAQMGVTMSKPLQSPVAMQRPYHHHQAHMSGTSGSTSFAPSTAGSGLGLSAREDLGSGLPHGLSSFGNKAAITSGFMEQVAATNRTAGAGAGAAPNSLFHDMINSLSSPTGFDGSSSFEQSFDGISWNIKGDSINFHQGTTDHFSETTEPQLNRRNDHHEGRGNSNATSNIGGNDGLTRDFLGLKALPHRDFPNLAGLNHRINSSSSAYERQNQQSQTSWQG